MPGRAFCRVCEVTHERPVGRNCNRQQVGNATSNALALDDTANSSFASTSTRVCVDLNAQVLNKLSSIAEKIDSLDFLV